MMPLMPARLRLFNLDALKMVREDFAQISRFCGVPACKPTGQTQRRQASVSIGLRRCSCRRAAQARRKHSRFCHSQLRKEKTQDMSRPQSLGESSDSGRVLLSLLLGSVKSRLCSIAAHLSYVKKTNIHLPKTVSVSHNVQMLPYHTLSRSWPA
jgi:hypothetical protein